MWKPNPIIVNYIDHYYKVSSTYLLYDGNFRGQKVALDYSVIYG